MQCPAMLKSSDGSFLVDLHIAANANFLGCFDKKWKSDMMMTKRQQGLALFAMTVVGCMERRH